jgi:hypothetical protein
MRRTNPAASPPEPPPAITCGCGRTFTRSEFDSLPFVGTYDDGEGGTLVMRNCPCTSTHSLPELPPSLAPLAKCGARRLTPSDPPEPLAEILDWVMFGGAA